MRVAPAYLYHAVPIIYIAREIFPSVTEKPHVHIKKKRHCTSVSVLAHSETNAVYTIPSITKASKPGLLQT